MSIYTKLTPVLFLLPPEVAHSIAIKTLKGGLLSRFALPTVDDPRLAQNLWGLNFIHPLGLAAGFDKNAECLNNFSDLGLGFAEVGTVTRYPQLGNPKPRLFRLKQDQALINRMGFNNDGIEPFLKKMRESRRVKNTKLPIGANIGINKNTLTPIEDYGYLLKRIAPHTDYVVVNVSSPNTSGLRELQKSQKLEELLQALLRVNTASNNATRAPVPLLIKIAPDLSDQELEDVARLALHYNLAGVIVSNTTIRHKDTLSSSLRTQQGGLSGSPLYVPSTIVLAKLFCLTRGRIPLIGVGGIKDGMPLYQKILAGASLCQLYTALVYQGPTAVHRILQELLALMEQDNVKHISQIIGANSLAWARHELPEAYL